MSRMLQIAVLVFVMSSDSLLPDSASSVVDHSTPGGFEPHETAPYEDRKRVIIDTDPAIGYLFKDVDDGIMLAMALRDPSLEVVGLTVGFGNTTRELAYRKAIEIARRAGRGDVPILLGASALDPQAQTDASNFIVEQVRAYPGEITVLAVGVLANVAAALNTGPDVARLVREIVTVGGHVRGDDRRPRRNEPYDLNYGSAPVAASRVFSSGARITVVPIELCKEITLSWSRLRAATQERGDLNRFVRRSSRLWFAVNAGSVVPWDVVGLFCLTHPEWFRSSLEHLEIHVFEGRRPVVTLQLSADGKHETRIANELTNHEQFWQWFEDRL